MVDVEFDTIRLRARLMRETGSEADVGFAACFALERFRGARIREFLTLLAELDTRRRSNEMRLNPVPSIESNARGPTG
jgi:hypothetical protein